MTVIREGKAFFACLVLSMILAISAPATTAAGSSPAIPVDARCAVCGMFAAKFPAWVSSVVHQDGSRAYFDGPKDLFTYCLNSARYTSSRQPARIASVQVQDYYSLTPIDGRKAWFVVGSDVYGPMGKELVPFAKESDARGFLKDHKGTGILRFDQVTFEVLKRLQ